MDKFYATIEFLRGQRAAILTLTTQAGEWSGSGRIEVRSGLQSDLYEEAYKQASLNAQFKGGRLERFSVVRESCGSRVQPVLERRPANALNIEIGQPSARCLNKRPDNWPDSMSSVRWLASGGEALIFGSCGGRCPLEEPCTPRTL
jgi:hypothetical protein